MVLARVLLLAALLGVLAPSVYANRMLKGDDSKKGEQLQVQVCSISPAARHHPEESRQAAEATATQGISVPVNRQDWLSHPAFCSITYHRPPCTRLVYCSRHQQAAGCLQTCSDHHLFVLHMHLPAGKRHDDENGVYYIGLWGDLPYRCAWLARRQHCCANLTWTSESDVLPEGHPALGPHDGEPRGEDVMHRVMAYYLVE